MHVHGVQERAKVIREHAARHLLRGTRVRLRRLAEPSQIRSKQLEALSEQGDERPPHVAELGPAMEQNQGRAATLAQVVNVDAVRMGIERLGHDALPTRTPSSL